MLNSSEIPIYGQGKPGEVWDEFDETQSEKRKLTEIITKGLLQELISLKIPRVIGNPGEDLEQKREEWLSKKQSQIYGDKVASQIRSGDAREAAMINPYELAGHEAKEKLENEIAFESELLYSMALLTLASQRDPILKTGIDEEKWLNWAFLTEKFGASDNHDLKGFYTEYMEGGGCPLSDTVEYQKYKQSARDYIKNNPDSLDILGLSE